MRWLASRFLDTDAQEELGILTPAVRARKAAQDAAIAVGRLGHGGTVQRRWAGTASPDGQGRRKRQTAPGCGALPNLPPSFPARLQGLDLGPACSQCGGMMQRTGSCYTCSSCGNNTGCG